MLRNSFPRTVARVFPASSAGGLEAFPQAAAQASHCVLRPPARTASSADNSVPLPDIPMANSSIMNTYTKTACNSCQINTYKNKGLKVPHNQHLQKNRGVGGLIVTFPALRKGYSNDRKVWRSIPAKEAFAVRKLRCMMAPPQWTTPHSRCSVSASIPMPEQVIKRRSRGFICINAHPDGCRRKKIRLVSPT